MDLGKTQLLFLVTKGVTTVLGFVQSFIIIRLLLKADFGLVGLVMSVGGVVGVLQHLGVVEGVIREIATLKAKRDIGKVFWVANFTRQIVTIPLSFLLFMFAGSIAAYYEQPIAPYIQIFAAILVLQGFQDVLGAVLTGMRKFVALYVVQIVTALINIAVFGYLTWRWDTIGYFWAIVLTTAIMVTIFFVIIVRDLWRDLALPTVADLGHSIRKVMGVGLFIYVSRIFSVVWQRLPFLMLGTALSTNQLGDLNISLTFGSKLTIIAMGLSEINLAWMSSLFARQRQEFERVVTHNLHRVLLAMISLVLVMIFFTPEIIQYIIGNEYAPAHHVILVMTVAFFLYSLTDIGTSSVFVSANKPQLRAYLYGLMTAITALIIWYIKVNTPSPLGAAYAVLAGAIASYIAMVLLVWRQFSIRLVTWQLGIFLVALFASMWWLFTNPPLLGRIGIFLLLMAYIAYEAHRSQLVPKFVLRWLPLGKKEDTTVVVNSMADLKVICFAGAAYDQLAWTNRQHIMSRVAKKYPVLYVEPRVWIVRHLLHVIYRPKALFSFLRRLFWYEKRGENLYIKAQWNLIPGSREIKTIAIFNHWLNRFVVLMFARTLGFTTPSLAVWVYDTEAAEYLSAFRQAIVLYDCVDDHAAQAGVDRNSQRVQDEEAALLDRADIVTVTSKRLYNLKKRMHPNVHLVLNAGNVDLFLAPAIKTKRKSLGELTTITHPIIGSVGTLDAYKIDFTLVEKVAKQKPEWNFVFIGSPLVGQSRSYIRRLKRLPNVHFLGSVPHEEVPAYAKLFDVCLIPYKASRYNEASFPLKFWEFMATGKPVVVAGVPELREYKPTIAYVKAAKDMIVAIDAALKEKDTAGRERITMAKSHTWDKRVESLIHLLKKHVEKTSPL